MTGTKMDEIGSAQVGRYFWESTPSWHAPKRAIPGAANVLIVVLDDVGFAQLGCFGSDIDTPTFDKLASNGLRYTNFHTTALCSPTRSCVLTGRNHHRNGMGRVIEVATGFPGYNAIIPRENGFLSEILVDQGYATFAVGKWHLTPEDQCHMAAPRDSWPLGRGFERFYGFFNGETHQFSPALVSDNHQYDSARTWQEGYHLTEDLVDQAIGFIKDLRSADPNKPFFMYLCPGACHSPHQAPAEWIERYRGRFESGWDVWRAETLRRQVAQGILPESTELSPRPDWVPAWDSLNPQDRLLYSRYMEAFAGFLSHADHHIGRFLHFLDIIGDLDNTLVIVLSDNGASSEGGPTGSVNDLRWWNKAPRPLEEAHAKLSEIGGPYCHNNYPWGWTVAGNTPFRRWKREVHEGGVADPLIVHWPAHIVEQGACRRQYVHAIDLLPTILESVKVSQPQELHGITQSKIDGVSFYESFLDSDAPSRRHTQYYEMFGCRALYHDGWKAVTYHTFDSEEARFEKDVWELYDIVHDVSECHDLAREYPDKVRDMVEMWWVEAGRNGVLPLDNRPFSAFVLERPISIPARSRYVYYPGSAQVPEVVAVNVRNRSHRITAEVDVKRGPLVGTVLAQGSALGGWMFFAREGRLCYVHNYLGLELHEISGVLDVAEGHHVLQYRFTRTGDHRGQGELVVDGDVVGVGEIPIFTPHRFTLTGAGLTCGYSGGLPVVRDVRSPFRFNGSMSRVVVEVDGTPFIDPESEAYVAIITQ